MLTRISALRYVVSKVYLIAKEPDIRPPLPEKEWFAELTPLVEGIADKLSAPKEIDEPLAKLVHTLGERILNYFKSFGKPSDQVTKLREEVLPNLDKYFDLFTYLSEKDRHDLYKEIDNLLTKTGFSTPTLTKEVVNKLREKFGTALKRAFIPVMGREIVVQPILDTRPLKEKIKNPKPVPIALDAFYTNLASELNRISISSIARPITERTTKNVYPFLYKIFNIFPSGARTRFEQILAYKSTVSENINKLKEEGRITDEQYTQLMRALDNIVSRLNKSAGRFGEFEKTKSPSTFGIDFIYSVYIVPFVNRLIELTGDTSLRDTARTLFYDKAPTIIDILPEKLSWGEKLPESAQRVVEDTFKEVIKKAKLPKEVKEKLLQERKTVLENPKLLLSPTNILNSLLNGLFSAIRGGPSSAKDFSTQYTKLISMYNEMNRGEHTQLDPLLKQFRDAVQGTRSKIVPKNLTESTISHAVFTMEPVIFGMLLELLGPEKITDLVSTNPAERASWDSIKKEFEEKGIPFNKTWINSSGKLSKETLSNILGITKPLLLAVVRNKNLRKEFLEKKERQFMNLTDTISQLSEASKAIKRLFSERKPRSEKLTGFVSNGDILDSIPEETLIKSLKSGLRKLGVVELAYVSLIKKMKEAPDEIFISTVSKFLDNLKIKKGEDEITRAFSSLFNKLK